MFAAKITLEPQLHKRALAKAKELGYSSLDEYVAHLLEKELNQLTPEEDEAVQERLKGLGYL